VSVQLEALADEVFEAAGAANQAIADVVRHPFGVLLGAPRYPDVFFLNGLKELRAPEWRRADVEAVLHRALPWASYDRVVTRDSQTRTALEAELLAAGYLPEHKTGMLQVTVPPGVASADVQIVPVSSAGEWDALDAQVRDDWASWPSATISQIVEVFHAFTRVLPDRFYLAVAGGRPVGRVGLLVYRRMGYVHGLVTAPDARRRGVATALMREMEKEAQAAGCDRLCLLCDSDSWLPGYYARLGYVIVGEEYTWRKRRS
jgi:GNAT superfamily N-acetyltransferase